MRHCSARGCGHRRCRCCLITAWHLRCTQCALQTSQHQTSWSREELMLDAYKLFGAVSHLPNLKHSWHIQCCLVALASSTLHLQPSKARLQLDSAHQPQHAPCHSSQLGCADPARAGLGASLVSLLLELRAANVVYISCIPPTQVSTSRGLTWIWWTPSNPLWQCHSTLFLSEMQSCHLPTACRCIKPDARLCIMQECMVHGFLNTCH